LEHRFRAASQTPGLFPSLATAAHLPVWLLQGPQSYRVSKTTLIFRPRRMQIRLRTLPSQILAYLPHPASNESDTSLIDKIRRIILNGAGLLLAAAIGLRAVLELIYFDNPRRPDPATGRTVPYVVKNVTIYVTENLGDVFFWLQWSFYFLGAVVVVSAILNLVLSLRSNK
jgi:hypothetical protein